MVSLKPPPASWSDEILNVAIQFMNAEVCFYDEGEPTTPYDPITGTGGENGIVVIWQGKARVQQLRSPREFATDYQAGANRNFRYQLDPNDDIPFIPQGTKSRVLNGGRDKDLEKLVLVVNSAINSSHMAVRTVELVATLDGVSWTWQPSENENGYGWGGYGE